MTIFAKILVALGLRRKTGRILDVVRYDRGECERALAEAERRLAMQYAGDGVVVTANPGTTIENGAAVRPGTRLGAVTTGGSRRQFIALYVDPKTHKETWEELVHEMAHAVLFSHDRNGHPPEYAGRFIFWRNA